MSHMYRNVANFLQVWLNYGYWKSFKALDLSWFNFEVLKRFGYMYIWLVKITRAGHSRVPEVDSIR